MLTRLIKIPKRLDLFLFGPRSTGKTTLLNELFSAPSTCFFNLLDPETFEQFQESPAAFKGALGALSKQVENVVVDEVQRIPALLDVVQEFMGQERFRFVLTGSSARKLRRGHANLLGGRAVTRSLWPLSLFETLHIQGNIERKLRWGGLPKVFLAQDDEERKDLLRTYVQTYLAEEVVAEQLVRNLLPFRKFLAVAAQMNGKIVNTNAIGRDIGTSHNTVRSYYEILEDTLVGFSVPAYHSSVRKRVRSGGKFYLFDPGVCRALARLLDAPLQPGTSSYGDVFEHLVMCEVKTLCSYLKPDWEIFFLQTASGSEIDLIIDRGDADPIAIEIKSAGDIARVSLTAEIALLEDFKASQRFVLSQDRVAKALSPHVRAVYWLDGLAEIFSL